MKAKEEGFGNVKVDDECIVNQKNLRKSVVQRDVSSQYQGSGCAIRVLK